jgi:hypothetical protein
MSLGHGASIVRDGLVFCYDQGNIQKSWKGAPATNLFTETNLNNWSISGATISTSQYVTPFDDAAYAITDSNTGAYSNIDRNTTVANNSASYTISLMVRKTYGATSARLGFNIGFNGGTQVALSPRFNSDTGVGYGNSVDFGDWWYWYFTITNNSSGNTNLYCQFFPATGVHNGSDNTIGVGTAIIGSMMLVAGSVAARFVNGARSNAQALLDMTGQNTITATNLTYASNNSFSFDGVDDYLDCGTSIQLTNNFTLEAWHKNINTGYLIDQGALGTDPSGCLELTNRGLTVSFNNGESVTAAGAFQNTATWNNVTMSFSSGVFNFYINGIFDSTRTTTTTAFTPSGILKIGRRAFNNASILSGEVSVVKVYNKVLTAAEVKQNFEAIRGRYGI